MTLALALVIAASAAFVYIVVTEGPQFERLFVYRLVSAGIIGWNWNDVMKLFLGANPSFMISTLLVIVYLVILGLLASVIKNSIENQA